MSDYEIAAADGERLDHEVDFGAEFAPDGDKWAVRVTVTSNHRKDVYAYTGFSSEAAARAAVNRVVMAVAASLGIETDHPFGKQVVSHE